MLDSLFLHLRRPFRFRAGGVVLALLVAQWVSVSVVTGAGKSIFDNDPATDPTEKPSQAKMPAPRVADVPAPPARPAEPIPPAPATSPASPSSGANTPGESALPIPSSADISRSAKLIKELFASELADHTPAGRRALAATMMKNVDKNADDSSAQYVLLSQARDLAASAGDVSMAADADSELSERFRQSARSALKTRLMALSSAVATRNRAGSRSAEEASDSMDALNESADASIRLGDLAAGDKFVDLAQTVAQSCGDSALIAAARARSARQKSLHQEFDAFALAQVTLSSDPTDPASNLAVARYLCDVKLDWQRGIPLLRKGSDAALKQIADQEMTPPGEADAQESLGTAWWDIADRSPAAEQDWLRRRALYWYERSAPGLVGLAKERAENRLADHPELMYGELALAMGGVKISKAVYGAGDQSSDFTDMLQKALDRDPYLPIVANNTIVGDPAQGALKSVRLTYAWHGKSTDTEIGEETAAVLPGIPEMGLKIRGASKRFRIVAIRWGWGSQSRDVTAVLAPLMRDPTKPFTPSASDVAPDPASGIHKWLVVWFDNHGRRFARLCRDDAWPITLLPAN